MSGPSSFLGFFGLGKKSFFKDWKPEDLIKHFLAKNSTEEAQSSAAVSPHPDVTGVTPAFNDVVTGLDAELARIEAIHKEKSANPALHIPDQKAKDYHWFEGVKDQPQEVKRYKLLEKLRDQHRITPEEFAGIIAKQRMEITSEANFYMNHFSEHADWLQLLQDAAEHEALKNKIANNKREISDLNKALKLYTEAEKKKAKGEPLSKEQMEKTNISETDLLVLKKKLARLKELKSHTEELQQQFSRLKMQYVGDEHREIINKGIKRLNEEFSGGKPVSATFVDDNDGGRNYEPLSKVLKQVISKMQQQYRQETPNKPPPSKRRSSIFKPKI